MLEVAVSLMINLAFFLGALEVSWYLYVRQALVKAAREGVRTDFKNLSERVVEVYLIGYNFPESFIDQVTVSTQTTNLTSPKAEVFSVTVTVPLSAALLFGGNPSGLLAAAGGTELSVTAYQRNYDVSSPGNSKNSNAGGNGNN